ncbi:MAG: hypothetical protein IKN74_01960 [Clostridia bacterium]|nr:hypothetical protein [Clostridia bacterium]
MFRDFEKSMMENDGITKGDFYTLIHETYDEICKYMTKADFARWIDRSRISESLKTLIVEQFNEEDFKEKPGAAGYFNRVKNVIKFKDKSESTRRVSDHENMHLMSGENRFPTFLNEALTEYISRAVKGEVDKNGSYEFNVRTVKFLHFVLGDSLIKNYLSGVTDEFKNYFSTFLTPDGSENYNEYSGLMLLFEEYHENAYSIREDQKQTPEREEKAKEAMFKINEKLLQMAKGYIRKEVHSLEYIKDGKIDVSILTGRIATLKKFLEETGGYKYYDKNLLMLLKNGVLEQELGKALAEEFLFDSSDKENASKALTQKILDKEDISKDIKMDNPDFAMRLAENRLKKYSESRDVSNLPRLLSELEIIFEKTGATDFQKEAIIGEKLFKSIPDGVDFSVVRNNIGKVMPTLAQVTEEKRVNDAHTRTTEYLKLSPNEYIQKTDNEFYHVVIENGEIKKQRVDTTEFALPQSEISRTFKAEDVLKAGKDAIAYRTLSGGRILISRNLNECFTTKKTLSSREKLSSMDAFMEDIYTEAMIAPIREQMQSDKYRRIMHDADDPYFIKGLKYTAEVDKRSRELKIDAFNTDLKNVLSAVPEGKKENVAKRLISELIDKTYGKLPEDAESTKKKLEDIIYQKYTLSRKMEKLDEDARKLVESLNGYRRERVEEQSKYALVEIPEDKKYVYEVIMERKNKERKEKSDKAAVRDFYLRVSDYVVAKEPIRLEEENKPESRRIIDEALKPSLGYIGPIVALYTRTIDYEQFATGLKDTLDRISPEARENAFNTLMEKTFRSYYGMDALSERKPIILGEMKDAIKKKVFDGEELDRDLMARSQEELRGIVKEEFEEAKHSSAICVMDKTASVAFFSAMKISNNKDIPEDVKTLTIKEILRAAIDEKNPCYATTRAVLDADKKLSQKDDKEQSTEETK